MGALSIHNLDPETERRIRERAKAAGKSLNQTAKELLADAVGVGVEEGKPIKRRGDFDDLCGVWSDEDAREFDEAIVALGVEDIDPEDWQ